MKANQTELAGVLLIEPTIHLDSRGRFFESYAKEKFHALGIQEDFVQDNQSLSQKKCFKRAPLSDRTGTGQTGQGDPWRGV